MNFIDLIIKRKPRIAVLIDADNIPMASIGPMLEEVSRRGDIRLIRAYGNWCKPIKSWKPTLAKHQIVPVHLFNSAVGKNSADILLVIDAMDLIHDKKVDIICIASSDSDFTRLAIRIRESGTNVIFAGEVSKVSKNAGYSNFDFIDVTIPDDFKRESAKRKLAAITTISTTTALEVISNVKDAEQKQESLDHISSNDDLQLVSNLITSMSKCNLGSGGWTFLGAIGAELKKIKPEFDPKKYGFSNLSELILANSEKYDTFIVPGPSTAPAGVSYLYVRPIEHKPELV